MPEEVNAQDVTYDDLLAAFGISGTSEEPPAAEPPTEEPPAQGTETTTETPPAEENQGQDEPGQNTEDPNQQQQQQQTNLILDKQNQAFARMRTENSQMVKALRAEAELLGINPKLPADQLAAEIHKKTTEALAKKNNMDPQILSRLNELEDINARYQQQEQQKYLTNAVNTIKTKFGATDDDIMAFAQELDKEGYDPYAKGANMVSEFITRNFDKIVKQRVDAAVKAEQERASKASSASKPSGNKGQDNSSEATEVKSQSDFDAYMNSLVNN